MGKRGTIFLAVAVLILAAIIGIVVYSMIFLTSTIKPVLEEEASAPSPIVKFNFDGLKELGITE
ncbi:MAG: hypothetical protein AAB498_00755 [Patescibacteria group bacterium]